MIIFDNHSSYNLYLYETIYTYLWCMYVSYLWWIMVKAFQKFPIPSFNVTLKNNIKLN